MIERKEYRGCLKDNIDEVILKKTCEDLENRLKEDSDFNK